MDEACKIFSSSFYSHLLKGMTIINSYGIAKEKIMSAIKSNKACCCAHDHKPGCIWEKFATENPDEAHALHSEPCGCTKLNKNGILLHETTCQVLINFKRKM
jgi:hypothetical protein